MFTIILSPLLEPVNPYGNDHTYELVKSVFSVLYIRLACPCETVVLPIIADGVSGLKHNESTRKLLRQKALNNGSVERAKAMAIDPIFVEKRKKATTGKKRTIEAKNRMAQAKQHKARSFSVSGICFSSIASFAQITNNHKTTIRRWLDNGDWDKLEKAYHA